MAEAFLPVTREVYGAVLRRAAEALDSGMLLMPIGGSGVFHGGWEAAARLTKDVDLVVLLADGPALRVPPFARALDVARRLGGEVRPRKDQTGVEVGLRLPEGRVRLELIRGRNPASGGYFVTRRVLEALARASRRDGVVLEPPPEGLAVLKAWAAVDQQRIVAAGRDPRGFHALRAAGFRSDVRAIRAALLDRGHAPSAMLAKGLLDACPSARRGAIRAILAEAGWAGV